DLNETYHSVHGAIQESVHVFIKSGLVYVFEKKPSLPISIFEVGFGTGLNALLTIQYVQDNGKAVNYTAIEHSPLEEEIWSRLNYASLLDLTNEFENLHVSTWDRFHSLTPNFNFLKLKTTLQEVELSKDSINLVYYDAFAPSKQPELWTVPVLEKIFHALRPGGVMVTYCAKGQLKRDLSGLGLVVESLAGPPGKKEMVRATKV
ncbi:MAG TPA: tRNA (5-methylaminomethyl-2-thiouridine)(34)-methyltransferase MnmD, partial [Chryseolinea sp.]|nr:tRNA (5-methylaminomethyl-2-thiouridine)(34)-methyltransferase MnmD [Chryseolinea sp.]